MNNYKKVLDKYEKGLSERAKSLSKLILALKYLGFKTIIDTKIRIIGKKGIKDYTEDNLVEYINELITNNILIRDGNNYILNEEYSDYLVKKIINESMESSTD